MSPQMLDAASTGLSTSLGNVHLAGGRSQWDDIQTHWLYAQGLPLSTGQNLESVGTAYRALIDSTLLELLQAVVALHSASLSLEEVHFRGRPISRREIQINIEYRGQGKPRPFDHIATDEE